MTISAQVNATSATGNSAHRMHIVDDLDLWSRQLKLTAVGEFGG